MMMTEEHALWRVGSREALGERVYALACGKAQGSSYLMAWNLPVHMSHLSRALNLLP